MSFCEILKDALLTFGLRPDPCLRNVPVMNQKELLMENCGQKAVNISNARKEILGHSHLFQKKTTEFIWQDEKYKKS